MASLCTVILALTAAVPPEQASSSSQSASAETPMAVEQQKEVGQSGGDLTLEKLRKRTGRELLAAVRETLARLADPEDDELEAAVEELLFVYEELREDCEMAGSHREYYAKKVAFRLQQLSIQLKKRIARNVRLGKTQQNLEAPERIRGHHEVGEQLGQRAGVAPPAPPRRASGTGGAAQRMPNDDYGQQLVELIQKTIAPSTWDVNGGLGTIFYWRPGRALVVRQTGEVHDQMGDALQQLRRAGP